MSLVIHIGLHKTGTSAVQEHLFENRVKLLEAGLNYPSPLCQFPSHGELAWCFLKENAPWKDKEYNVQDVFSHYKYIFEKNTEYTTIVSSEDMSLLPILGREFRDFTNFMKDYNPLIAVYVRNPYDYLVSSYHHAIREGYVKVSFKDYLAFSFFDRAVDYETRIARWADAFGSESIILREYFAKDSVADFYDLLEMSWPGTSGTRQTVNSGIHPWLSDAYRKAPDTSDGHQFREKLMELSKTLPVVNALEFYLGDEWEALLYSKIGLDYTALLSRYSRRSIGSSGNL
ncbi:hypothetical protein FB480_108142 [Agrobacterium vitis]|nr:hypothetical protein FB480_108142 [Agrobacterium vitis]